MRNVFKNSGIPQMLGGKSLAQLIRLTNATSTVTYVPEDLPERMAKLQPAILAFWHGQFMMIPAIAPKTITPHSMVARHDEAETIGQVLKSFDMQMIRGAGAAGRKKDRGGAAALRAALNVLDNNECVAMTADVPPGPARTAGEGIITIARMSGCPIIPCAVASSRFTTLNTWSRITVNLPFSKIAAVMGEPIHVPSDVTGAQIDVLRHELEDAINATTQTAYSTVGRDHKLDRDHARERRRTSRLIAGYTGLTRKTTNILGPRIIKKRLARGKEHPDRTNERMGIASCQRPAGRLIHVHAASVGELNAVIPLIESLLAKLPDLHLLVTSGTLTSAKIAADRLPDRAIHQFAPLDFPEYQERFYEHWKPDLVIVVESELWPNMVMEVSRRAIPLSLINARLSKTSARNWQLVGRAASPLFARFDLILSQNKAMANRFRRLGAQNVESAGNLKIDSPKLPVDAAKLQALQQAAGQRPVFLAASTHPSEDEFVLKADAKIRQEFPDLLTVIAPRHPDRGNTITQLAQTAGYSTVQRTGSATLKDTTQIYVADTIGELGTLYSLADIAFIGGSLTKRGGQNPIEAVRFSTPIIYGPNVDYFADAHRALVQHSGIVTIETEDQLANAVRLLLRDETEAEELVINANAALNELSGALPFTMDQILKTFPFIQDAGRDTKAAGSKVSTDEPKSANKHASKNEPASNTEEDETRAS